MNFATCRWCCPAIYAAIAAYFAISPGASAQSPSEELWKLVAQSHMIVVGTPGIPTDQIEKSGRDGHYDYINFSVRVDDCLKANSCPETITVRYFTRPASDSPAPQTLVESNGNRSVLFLIQVDTQTVSQAPEIYFAGHTSNALQPFSEDFVRQIRAETQA